MSRAWCLVTDLYICDIMQMHRRLPQYYRHSTYHMIILGGNFDAGVCLGVGLIFFCVVDVYTCAHDVQRRIPRDLCSQSVWVALSQSSVSTPRHAAAFVCYVYFLP